MKKILTICAILILTIIAGVFWFAQNEKVAQNDKQVIVKEISQNTETQIVQNDTETEFKINTSNWKTYANTSCNFEIKIPQEWTVNSDIDCSKFPNITPKGIGDTYMGVEFVDSSESNKSIPMQYHFAIYSFSNDNIKSAEDKMGLSKMSKKDVKVINSKIKLTQYIDSSRNDEDLSRNYILSNKSNTRHIFVLDVMMWDMFSSIDSDKYIRYKKIFDGVVQSFKFVE